MLRRIRTHLNYKIGISVALIALVIFTCILALMLSWQKDLVQKQVTSDTQKFTNPSAFPAAGTKHYR
ncbi:MAG: hypothetical protein ACLFOA_00315 [Desulfohalobiaceae bacterium]